MNEKIKKYFVECFSSFKNFEEKHFFNSKLKKAIHKDAELLWKDINNSTSYQDIFEAIVLNLIQVSCDRILLNSPGNRLMEQHDLRTGGVIKISDDKDKFEKYIIKNLDKCISGLDSKNSDEAQLVKILQILKTRIDALPSRFFVAIQPGYVKESMSSHSENIKTFLLKGDTHPEWMDDPTLKKVNLLSMVQSLDNMDKTKCAEQKQESSLKIG